MGKHSRFFGWSYCRRTGNILNSPFFVYQVYETRRLDKWDWIFLGALFGVLLINGIISAGD
jgi:hypothetical protein